MSCSSERAAGDGMRSDDSDDSDRGTEVDNTDANTDAGDRDITFEVSVNLSDAIGTVGIVEWSTNVDNEIDAATIDFGLDSEYGMTAPVELTAEYFRTLLLGMKGSSDYHVRVNAVIDGTTYRSHDVVITTEPVTNVIQRADIIVAQSASVAPGFFVLASYTAASFSQNPMAFIIDNDGDIVWWYAATALSDSTRARMSYDGKWMAVVSSNNQGNAGAVELVSMDGQEVKQFTSLTGAAHDLTPVDDNTFAWLEYTPEGGFGNSAVCARVMSLDTNGNIGLIYDTADTWGTGCHGNALRYSMAEQLFTVSDYEHGEIVAFDKSGDVAWVTQNDGLWKYQHGHHLLNNSILIFNNGGSFSDVTLTSEALEYEFSSDTGGLREIWRYRVEGLGTPTLGDVQRLPNGNTLVSYSNKALMHEVAADEQLVRSIDLGQAAFGYVVWRPTLYGHPVDLEQ
ncbi:MAG: aryl-sulfate sulfotransferase [Deltaproteobacteria bacterium]|nr:aryl-sulfate sulfotransferase [Deltaproteobacteria bacterium]MBN2670967.1 aryl-sulfate sulfotransferase [Deltaproteobacteria bacterium]